MRAIGISILSAAFLAACDNPDVSRSRPASEPGASVEGQPAPDALTEGSGDAGRTQAQSMEPSPQQQEAGPGPAYVGFWAKTAANCGSISGDDKPFEINQRTFGGYEVPCTFSSLAERSANEWEGLLTCEGTSQPQRITMAVQDNSLYVTYHDRDDQGVSYFRCQAKQ